MRARAVVGTGLSEMFDHPFMANAFLAGTAIALACGLVGYFLVLRAQVFTGDALSHVAFTGALGALALGVDLRIGLFATTIAVALLLGALGRRGRADDVVIGNVFAWILGLGVFFLTLYTTSRSHANGSAGVTVLFGSVFGITAGPARTAALIATLVVVATLFVARPLLFASVDEAVAAARGVPVRLLGFAFLAVVGTTAAEATQVVGALLLLGLIAAPAGTAILLTDRPYRALGLSAALAVAAVWIGLTASYLLPRIPPSFAIITTATTFYLLAFAATRLRRIWRTVDQRVVPVAS
ncbi:metal ABC transporter permease [Streptomyces sp.]|jgi:zinc/manganese transport system permease protein|uniref:metal ABC transporter permease n=1 Tax=Streptomyces sp. TaxID=1931 RepID=UPI0025F6F95D|nr:metal ABC transporter permease [Streptomyces sp.]